MNESTTKKVFEDKIAGFTKQLKKVSQRFVFLVFLVVKNKLTREPLRLFFHAKNASSHGNVFLGVSRTYFDLV